jgi:hypothetical protein
MRAGGSSVVAWDQAGFEEVLEDRPVSDVLPVLDEDAVGRVSRAV